MSSDKVKVQLDFTKESTKYLLFGFMDGVKRIEGMRDDQALELFCLQHKQNISGSDRSKLLIEFHYFYTNLYK